MFIGHFKANYSVSTVARKAVQLVTAFNICEQFALKEGEVKLEKNAPGIADNMRQTSASYKTESRKNSSVAKNTSVRARLETTLFPADWALFS